MDTSEEKIFFGVLKKFVKNFFIGFIIKMREAAQFIMLVQLLK
jgi:hypothetical protein